MAEDLNINNNNLRTAYTPQIAAATPVEAQAILESSQHELPGNQGYMHNLLSNIDKSSHVESLNFKPEAVPGSSPDTNLNELQLVNPDKKQESGQSPVYYEVKKKKVREQKELNPNILEQLAQHIMTKKVITFYSDTNLEDAWKVFQNVSFRHIPVIDNDNKVIGMVSYNSLLNRIHESSKEKTATLKIKTLMFRNVLVIGPDTPVRSIALNLFNKNIGAMPVIDKSGALKGIVTRSDILKAFFIKKAAIDLKG